MSRQLKQKKAISDLNFLSKLKEIIAFYSKGLLKNDLG